MQIVQITTIYGRTVLSNSDIVQQICQGITNKHYVVNLIILQMRFRNTFSIDPGIISYVQKPLVLKIHTQVSGVAIFGKPKINIHSPIPSSEGILSMSVECTTNNHSVQ